LKNTVVYTVTVVAIRYVTDEGSNAICSRLRAVKSTCEFTYRPITLQAPAQFRVWAYPVYFSVRH